MLTMGIDTALQRCSVAILRDDVLVAQTCVDMERGHAEHLAPMTVEILEQSGLVVSDFDRIGVVVGPGGFTGVRVALSFARGLVIGTNVVAVGVTSLAALAGSVSAPKEARIASVIDARRGQVYAGLYGAAGNSLLEPFVATPEQALKLLSHKAGDAPILLIGSGASLLEGVPGNWALSTVTDQIDTAIVARLAAKAPAPTGPPGPLYLRAPDAKPAKAGPLDGITPRG